MKTFYKTFIVFWTIAITTIAILYWINTNRLSQMHKDYQFISNKLCYISSNSTTQKQLFSKTETEYTSQIVNECKCSNQSELNNIPAIIEDLQCIQSCIYDETEQAKRNDLLLVVLLSFLLIFVPFAFAMIYRFQQSLFVFIADQKNFRTEVESALENQMKLIERERDETSSKLLEQIQVNENLHNTLTEKLEEQVQFRTEQIMQKNEEIIAQRDELANQKAIIAAKNKDLIDSLTYARQIQDATLVGRTETISHFKDAFILYEPRDVISGDFYWFCHYGNKLIFAVADCTGHGVPGAVLTMMGNSLLNQLVLKDKVHDPGEILTHLNVELINSFRKVKARTKIRDGMDISIVQIDSVNNKISFAGAKHPLYWWHNNEFTIIQGKNASIGGMQINDKATVFETEILYVNEGDVLYMFSDGFSDQFGGEKQKKYMRKNFRDFLATIAHHPMSLQKEKLKTEMYRWRGKQEQTDDILVVGWTM